MKNSFLWMIIPLVCSCTPDENPITQTQEEMKHSRVADNYPANPINAYDIAGKLHYNLCLAFWTTPPTLSSIEDAMHTTNALTADDLDFQSIKPVGYNFTDTTALAFVFDAPDNLWDLIEETQISPKAKVSMANFLATLDYLSKHDSDYDTLYQFIVDYESSVADDSSFGSTDRQMIFTATSIARFDYYFASQHKGKPPRDRDWDANIGNIAAALSGSQQSTAQAVSMSVAASIYRNR